MLDHDNLEEFADPANYDRQDPSDTGVAFYSALAQETGGPVLELACGTGRVAVPIARLGIAVTGLDIVPGMLARAESKSAGLPVRWVQGDARTFTLAERFRLIFLTGNAFQAFVTNAEQEALLQRVRLHLHDEGLFAFETRNPLLPQTTVQAGAGFFVPLETQTEETEWPPFVNVDGQVGARLHDTGLRPRRASRASDRLQALERAGEARTQVTRTALRYTFPQELAALLHYNGFTIVRQYGDWNGEPLTATSPSILSVCRGHR